MKLMGLMMLLSLSSFVAADSSSLSLAAPEPCQSEGQAVQMARAYTKAFGYLPKSTSVEPADFYGHVKAGWLVAVKDQGGTEYQLHFRKSDCFLESFAKMPIVYNPHPEDEPSIDCLPDSVRRIIRAVIQVENAKVVFEKIGVWNRGRANPYYPISYFWGAVDYLAVITNVIEGQAGPVNERRYFVKFERDCSFKYFLQDPY